MILGDGERMGSDTSQNPSRLSDAARVPTSELAGAQGMLVEHEDVDQGAAMLQQVCNKVHLLFDTVQRLQQDMQELKGSVERVSPAYIHQLMDEQRKSMMEIQISMQDSIVKKLEKVIDKNHTEVKDLHGQQRELAETTLQKQDSTGIELQAMSEKLVPPLPVEEETRWRLSGNSGVEKSVAGSSRSESRPDEGSLVINFRRLVFVMQFFDLLHELIKSTAIAALTIVAAETTRQCVFTVLFIVLVFLLYARHAWVYDGMDIADVKSLMPSVRDDDQRCSPGQTNPNGLLKSLSLQRHGRCLWAGRFSIMFIIVASIMGWRVCVTGWNLSDEDSPDSHELHLYEYLDKLSLQVIGAGHNTGVLAMQLIVLDIMVFLESVFEYILWREVSMVMPEAPDGSVWDPREHGAPKDWLLGLPSMWFTSQHAKQRMKKYVVFAQLGSDKNVDSYELLPAELGRYALEEENRDNLSKALRESKWFDARTQQFVDAKGQPSEKPKALDITVSLFESQGYHSLQGESRPNYRGQFQKWGGKACEDEVADV